MIRMIIKKEQKYYIFQNVKLKETESKKSEILRKLLKNPVKRVVVEAGNSIEEAKKKGDDAEYKKSIEIAEEMLKDLIIKTEAVIRGERKDVI